MSCIGDRKSKKMLARACECFSNKRDTYGICRCDLLDDLVDVHGDLGSVDLHGDDGGDISIDFFEELGNGRRRIDDAIWNNEYGSVSESSSL